MRTLLFFMITISLANSIVFAQKTINENNPAINLNDFKHPQQYFLDTYGKDDSTRALINYYFRVRKAAAVETIVGLVLGSSSAIYISNAFSQNSNFSFGASLLAYYIIPFAGVFALEVIEGSVIRIVFTKQKLLRLIADYQHGKHLPKRFTRKRRFRREMERLRQ